MDSLLSDEQLAWIDGHTEHIDLVQSWESICNTYQFMQFTDEISDSTRIEEIKWIVKEINRFLTSMRKSLMKCQDMTGVQETLRKNFVPSGERNLDSRKQLVYQKYRQTWIEQMLRDANSMQEKNLMEALAEGLGNGIELEPFDD